MDKVIVDTGRIPTIGVMGSGNKPYDAYAIPLGRWIAHSGFHLLTGAGGGVMTAVSKAFYAVKKRKGKSIGIIPGKITKNSYTALSSYPNPWIEIPIFTHLNLTGLQGKEKMSRNHINILSSDVIVALPGSAGTISEIELALLYNKPVICFGPKKDFKISTNLSVDFSIDIEKITDFIIQSLQT